MKIILLGQVNSGKGTLGESLRDIYGFEAVSIGQLLRDETQKNTPEAKIINDYQTKGKLVPDDITLRVLKNHLNSIGDKNIIFDGYPRTLSQAQTLDTIAKIDAVLVLNVDDDIVMDRALGRRICKDCGSITHINMLNGKNCCPKCGGELYIRNDATREATLAKMESFNKETKPLIEFYSKRNIVYPIDANRNPDYTKEQAVAIIDKIK